MYSKNEKNTQGGKMGSAWGEKRCDEMRREEMVVTIV